MTGSQSSDALAHAVRLVHAVCCSAGPCDFLDTSRDHLRRRGVLTAVRRHATPVIFDWLMSVLSFQGISNRIAEAYLEQHGNITWSDVEMALAGRPACPKLSGYWVFDDCRYGKTAVSCSMPHLLATCPLPAHPLRNGRLNQTAYSLFFFMRDVAGGDFVGWIDGQIGGGGHGSDAEAIATSRRRLIEPLRGVYGVSDKVITLALAALLLGVGPRRRRWFEVGASMIVVDTLVHNFLHRTGILHRFDADHAYGAGCYRDGGCADLIRLVARGIDAGAFNPAFPANFPRFVQLAIWRYCAQREFNICNGNRIDDRYECSNGFCQLHAICDHVALHKATANQQLLSA